MGVPPSEQPQPAPRAPISIGKLFAINGSMIALAAWLLSLPGVIGALLLSVPVALVGARQLTMAGPMRLGFLASLVGGVAGSMLLGTGTWFMRALVGFAAGFIVAPLGIPLLFVQWQRMHRSGR